MKRLSRQQQIAHGAIDAFKNHQLAKKVDNGDGIQVWLCQQPGTGSFHFWVTVLPHTIVVSGDIGDNILNVSDRNSLGWAVGVCGETTSYDYAASKIRTGWKTFDPDKGREWLHYLLDEGYYEDAGKIAEIREILEDSPWVWEDDPSGHAFYKACHEAELDPEDIAHDYTEGHYWTIECLRTFSRLYREQCDVKNG